jgi:hypothetical protein
MVIADRGFNAVNPVNPVNPVNAVNPVNPVNAVNAVNPGRSFQPRLAGGGAEDLLPEREALR